MATVKVFQSYTRTDAAAAAKIAADLQDAGFTVWRDERLSGGQEWWDAILTQIRAADVVVFVLSENSLDSVPCQRELEYAFALRKAVLPVSIDSSVSPGSVPPLLASREWVELTTDERTSLLRLIRAMNSLPPSGALPDPLPTPPGVPLSYTTNLAARVHSEETLSAEEQHSLVFQLREGLAVEADRAECLMLLTKLRKRRDLLASVEREIDRSLATGAQEQVKAPVGDPKGVGGHLDPGPTPGRAASGKSRTKWILAAVGVIAVVAVAIGAVVLRSGPSRVDALRDQCRAGDYAACDELYFLAEAGRDDREFGATCGDTGIAVDGRCEAFSKAVKRGDNDELDGLWEECQGGNLRACDDLHSFAWSDTEYSSFGSTCGDRLSDDSYEGKCTTLPFPYTVGDDQQLDALALACRDGDMSSCDALYQNSPVDSAYELYGAVCGDLNGTTERAGNCAAQ